MALITINSQTEFDTAIKNGAILIDFNAPWCAPCRLQEPILNKIADRFDGRVGVAVLNIDNHQNIAKELGIQSIPTLVIFKNNKEIQRFVGLQPEVALATALDKLQD
ncbi:MAG: thioredoxin [Desulfobacteraceae bacterium]|nr:thioredoxin [Desulfobacteraceae bacterium]